MRRIENIHARKAVIRDDQSTVGWALFELRRQVLRTALKWVVDSVDGFVTTLDDTTFQLTAEPVVMCTGAFGFLYGFAGSSVPL